MSKILITGAGGLLGHHLLQALKESEYGSSSDILTPNKAKLDLNDSEAVLRFFEKEKPSIVVHCAAKVMGLRGNLDFQLESMIENLRINESVFKAVAKHPPEKIFFAGTAASYAYPYNSIPLMEKDFLNGDVHSGEFGYAWAKRMAYPWLKVLADDYDVSWTYGVFTNLFGPNDRFLGNFTHVIPALVNRAGQLSANNLKKDKKLQVWGNPEVTRDFLYAPEAAKATLACLRSSTREGRIVNIASGVETSMLEVASTISSEFGLDGIDWQSDKPVGVKRRFMDITNLNELGFTPEKNVSKQLELTINWYKQNQMHLR